MSVILHRLREHDGHQARFHLRQEPDGSGLLLANASTGARLSRSGVVIARALLEHRGDDVLASVVRSFPGVERERLRIDIDRIRALLDTLTAGGRHPITNLDERGAALHRRSLGAPLCADVSVGAGTAARDLLRPLWEAGIPQVVLVPTPDAGTDALRGLVEHAEDLGMVCGIRTRASAIGDALLDGLAAAGLDHLDVYWAGPEHDALYGEGDAERVAPLFARAHQRQLCPTAVVPLLPATVFGAEAVMDALAPMRPGAVTVFAIATLDPDDTQSLVASALPQAAAIYEEHCDRLGLGFVWAPPLERDPTMTLAEQARGGPRAAAEGTIRVESDGEVRPPTGATRVTARLGTDPWPRIWAAEGFRAWREGADDAPRCTTCPQLGSCSAGCPRDPRTWARQGGAR